MAGEITHIQNRPQTNGDVPNYSDTAKNALEWLKGKGSDALQSIESVFSTVTGKKALEQVAAYVQESEAVNTAMATRIYELLDREARLHKRLLAVEKRLTASLCIHVAIIGIVFYLLLRRA
jgi:hypothetical protein